MELRVLRYFVEAAREQSITRAAKKLHVSQPTLSRQLKDLEQELGKKLFTRGNYSIQLTDEGMLLRIRAEEILSLVEKTEEEFQSLDDVLGGDLYIGCAESVLVEYLADAVRDFSRVYPELRFHLFSGDTSQVCEKLDQGLLDLALIVEPPDVSRWNSLKIPGMDRWGLVLPKDHPLAGRKQIRPEDLEGQRLICSRQSIEKDIPRWAGEKADSFQFAGTANLMYNASIFVQEGLGLLLSFENLVFAGPRNSLVFRPLDPPLYNEMIVIWKKHQVFSPIARRFLDFLTDRFSESLQES